MTIEERNRVMRLGYHWLIEYMHDKRIDVIRRKLRDLRHRLDSEHIREEQESVRRKGSQT